MNTFLSEDLQTLKEQYQQFAKEKLAPVASDIACQRKSLSEFLKLVAQAGYLGITVPQDFGGQGANFLELILFAESMAFYEPGFVLSLAGHTVVIELIKQFGTEAQKSRYLPLLASGEYIGAFAFNEDELTDPPMGTTVVGTTVSSVGKENENNQIGAKSLSGKKCSVINGKLASLFVVLANESVNGEPIPALWLVDIKKSGVASGTKIECQTQESMLGLRSASIDEVQFAQCSLLEEDLLGSTSPEGLKTGEVCRSQLNFAHNISKTVMAAAAVGLSDGALSLSADYARIAKRSGKPLANSQSVQWKIADLAVEISAARLLTYRAAWNKDENVVDFDKDAAMCKSFAASAARLHSAQALQILGAHTKSPYSDLARLFTDAKAIEMIAGTTEEQKTILAIKLGV